MSYRPIVFIAGMPRSGSMWTYNVCRSLITAAGMNPWPEEVPLDETPAIQHALVHPPAPRQVYCIKTHFRIPLGKPYIRVICNYRDIRDATLSYMRFMKCSFEKALRVAQGSMNLTDHYLQADDPQVLPLRYDDILGEPVQVIAAISAFLELTVAQDEISEISQNLSREAVARRLEKLQHAAQNIPACSDETARLSRAANLDGSYRLHDHRTGFQTNHISSCRDGEWRSVLTDEQQDRLLTAASDWLKRYRFAP